MIDFTSALYLGLHHPSWELRPWSEFTTGVPAALDSPLDAEVVAHQLATLQGCEKGVLGTSTLHQFWDLFGMMARSRVAIYVDAGLYPIGRWGVERAAARGVPAHDFPHHDAEELRRRLKRDAQSRVRPLVVADSFCPGCGKSAPLAAYLDCVQTFGGQLVLDDTQALGIFGHSPGPDAPYGRGGGGMLRRSQAGGPEVLVISSLAKAFGAPVAVLCGSTIAVENFEANSETRMHCSPPSIAAVRAAEHALAVNRTHGDALRFRLAKSVTGFRHRAEQAGFQFSGGLFPVQTLAPSPEADAVRLHQRLLQRGIRTVLHYARNRRGIRISFLITARHTPGEIDLAVEALGGGLPQGKRRILSGSERQ